MKVRSAISGASIGSWAILIAIIFLFTTLPLVAMTSSFFAKSLLLLCLGYLATFTGFRILRRLERWLPLSDGGWDPLERRVLEFGLGIGTIALSMFFLGMLGLFRTSVAWALLALLALGPHVRFLRELRSNLGGASEKGTSTWILVLPIAMVGAMTFLESLAPATAQDALAYHLAVPAKYIESGGIRYIPESFFAQFPSNIEMLFTLGLLLQGSSLASGIHWLLGAALVAAVAALGRRLSAAGGAPPGGTEWPAPRPGLLAAAIFATVPTVALLAGCAYIDLGVVLFGLLSTLAFVRWWELGVPEAAPARNEAPAEPLPGASLRMPRRGGWLILSAVFAGLAAGSKYTGGAHVIAIACAPLLDGILRKRRARESIAPAGLAAVIAGAMASPWWIKNLIYTGNPLFPFLYGIFGGRDWDPERAMTLSAFLGTWGGRDDGVLGLLSLPFRLTFSARFFSMENFDGMIGPAFLIGAPLVIAALLWRPATTAEEIEAGVSARRRSAFLLVFSLALFHGLLWPFLSRQIRFLLPALALWAALVGASIWIALPAGGWRRVTSAALSLGVVFNAILISTHFAAHNPVPVVLGLEPEARYLAREVPCGDYPVFEYIERELPRESYILFGGTGNPGFLCKRRYHADSIFENRTLAGILREGGDPEGVGEALRRRGFTHLLFRGELVFDPSELRSGIPVEDQKLLAEYLNRSGKLLAQAGGTFLYRLGDR